jgi:hypothetical protein
MMKLRTLAALAAVAGLAAACQPDPSGVSPSERRLAEKIADSGDLLPLNQEGLMQLGMREVQNLMMQGGVSQDQAMQVLIDYSRQAKDGLPAIRETLVKDLATELSLGELDLLARFLTSEEGKSLQAKMQAALQNSGEQFQQLVSEQIATSAQRVRSAWPVASPPPPPPMPDLPPGMILPPS